MYLKHLSLKNYRLFQDVNISFREGMNVLIGKNSTGKSTVLEAIDFLLSMCIFGIKKVKIASVKYPLSLDFIGFSFIFCMKK
jgi:predicted ATP-dependent endonuclease of OLD family